jgi:hypothetical protein
VLVVTSWKMERVGVVNSRYSYHMCLRKEYFETLELTKGGLVHLHNGEICKF